MPSVEHSHRQLSLHLEMLIGLKAKPHVIKIING